MARGTTLILEHRLAKGSAARVDALLLIRHPGIKVCVAENSHLISHDRVSEAAKLCTDDRIRALQGRGNPIEGGDPGHDVLFLAPLGHPEGVDYVGRGHVKLQRLVHANDQLSYLHAIETVTFVDVRERPRELLCLDVHDATVIGQIVVLHDDDCAPDTDDGDQNRRNDCPEDLDAGMPMNGLSVLHISRPGAKLQDRIDGHGGNESEDANTDNRRKQVEIVDPLSLL